MLDHRFIIRLFMDIFMKKYDITGWAWPGDLGNVKEFLWVVEYISGSQLQQSVWKHRKTRSVTGNNLRPFLVRSLAQIQRWEKAHGES